jgi:hypothetical protein
MKPLWTATISRIIPAHTRIRAYYDIWLTSHLSEQADSLIFRKATLEYNTVLLECNDNGWNHKPGLGA